MSLLEREAQELTFDVLCQLLRCSPPSACQDSFAACDGVLALLSILQRRTSARFAALKALDHASQHRPANVAAAIGAGAIKEVFALLMHTLPRKERAQHQADMEGPSTHRPRPLRRRVALSRLTFPLCGAPAPEHALSIVVQWLLHASDDALLRLLRKFTVRTRSSLLCSSAGAAHCGR